MSGVGLRFVNPTTTLAVDFWSKGAVKRDGSP